MDLDSIDEGWKVYGVWCVPDLHAEEHGGYQHGHFIDNYNTEAEAIAAWNTRTPKQAIARDEGICLSYSGATKAGIVGEIVGQRRHFEMGGR